MLVYQLYLIANKEHESKKYNSLVSILNQCNTAIGRSTKGIEVPSIGKIAQGKGIQAMNPLTNKSQPIIGMNHKNVLMHLF